MTENFVSDYGKEIAALNQEYIKSGLIETESGRKVFSQIQERRINHLEEITRRMEEALRK